MTGPAGSGPIRKLELWQKRQPENRQGVRDERAVCCCAVSRFAILTATFYPSAMIRQIAPLFFTTDIPGTLAYYKDKLGFECMGNWQDPPIYAIVARDQRPIHFRCAQPPTANPDKYEDELLDAYLLVEDPDALYAEYSAKGVEFTRELANMPWNSREFVVKDCDGRLLAFGSNL